MNIRPRVLMPVTIRPSLHQDLRLRAIDQASLLATYSRPFAEVIVEVEDAEFPRRGEENFFARLARMRQHVIDTRLTKSYAHVLWIDSDIRYDRTLLEQLWPLRGGIAAALTLIEGTNIHYDTAGMRERFDSRSMSFPPYFGAEGPVVDLQAVGACVLIPADVHRRWRFEALGPEDQSWNTEYWLLCQRALKFGFQVRCDTRVQVHHADLTKYGEGWH